MTIAWKLRAAQHVSAPRAANEQGIVAALRIRLGLPRIAVLACCLLAFFLGVNGLGARSLWGDEAFSVYASRQSVSTLLSGFDAQPPLYHLLLAAARGAWGESEFALRFGSLCCGVLLVAIMARLGRGIGTPVSGLIIAFGMAVAPMLVYFMQEARMYSLGAMMTGGAMWLTTSLLRRTLHSPRRWIVYTAFTLGALFSHYYTVGVLFANALALMLKATADSRRLRTAKPLLAWLLSHGAIAFIFGAWFLFLQLGYFSSAGGRRASWIPTFDAILTNMARGINGLVFGMRANPLLAPVALLLFVLALLGIAGWWRWRKGRRFSFLISGWLLFGVLIVALTASSGALVPDYNPRYLLFVLPPVLVAAGGWVVTTADLRKWGVQRMQQQRSVRQATLARIAFALLLMVLPAVYGHLALLDMSWQKSRYAEMMREIQSKYQVTDGIVMLNSDQFPLYDYYGLRGANAWIQSNALWDPARVQELDAQYDAFAQDKTRIWLVNYGDAAAMTNRPHIEQRLNLQGARVYYQGYQDATLALYQVVGVAGDDVPYQQRDARFGAHIALTGTRLRAQSYRAGDVVTVDLLWRTDERLNANYTVFVHLRRAEDGEQVAAFDSPPVNGSMPTSQWTPGQTITDTHAVAIPADAAAGDYTIVIGLYEYPTFERLALSGQDTTELVAGTIHIGD